jgi:predicted GNAT superfamily acetyltransferase
MTESGTPRLTIRPLHTFDEYRQVMALEGEIWGYGDPEDTIGVPVFIITLKRGGILLGAYDGDRLVAFVYSIAGIKDGRATQWSHMLGVLPAYRGTGVGRELKLEQRRVSMAMGLDLMEWTYDPLQAVNAHLNVRRLGAIVDEYAENVYGESSSVLHRGNPTDRFIAQWWLRSPRVAAVLGEPVPGAGADAGADAAAGGPVPLGPWPAARAAINTVVDEGAFVRCADARLELTAPALVVVIPVGFTEMMEQAPDLARDWRQATRAIFGHYLSCGYRVVDFTFGPGPREGRYLLMRVDL